MIKRYEATFVLFAGRTKQSSKGESPYVGLFRNEGYDRFLLVILSNIPKRSYRYTPILAAFFGEYPSLKNVDRIT